MLPMGTIVTVCMIIGLLFATRLPVLNLVQKLPLLVRQGIGGIVAAAGAWNFFWHALRHLSDFWGIAALVSGLLMMITGAYIIKAEWIPAKLRPKMPVVLLLLLGCAGLYAWTIARL